MKTCTVCKEEKSLDLYYNCQKLEDLRESSKPNVPGRDKNGMITLEKFRENLKKMIEDGEFD